MKARLRHWASREGWDELVLVLAGVAFLCLTLLFVRLAAGAAPGGPVGFEDRIMHAMRQPGDPSAGIGPAWLPTAVRDITALGSNMVLTLLVALVTGFLLFRRRRIAAAVLVIASLAALGLSTAFKEILERPRPDLVPHLTEVSSPSFPSGHSLMASVVYLTLGALLGQVATRRREKIYVFLSALFLAVIIGLSRIYLGVHYPTDVLAGWSLGMAWALICWFALRRLEGCGACRRGDTSIAR